MAVASRTIEPPVRGRTSALMGLRITFSGLLCVAIVVLVGLAALNSEANLLFLLFALSLGVVVCSAVAPVLTIRKVHVERVAPMAVMAGRPFSMSYLVSNRRRWLRCWGLVIGEIPTGGRPARLPLGYVEVLDPGREVRLELTGLCPVRGYLPLKGVRLMSRFPFGLFACTVDLECPGELVVYPAMGRFRRDPWRERRTPESVSSRNTRRRNEEHEEFHGLREYRPGDNFRWIHWRRSARIGELVVRESTPARTQQLTVVLDPWPAVQPDPAVGGRSDDGKVAGRSAGDVLNRLVGSWRRPGKRAAGPWPEREVERIISLAATAACEALERGHRVGLIVRAAVPVVIAPSGGRSHRQRLLHELALIKPGAAESLTELVSRIRWSSGWQGRCMVCATQQRQTHGQVVRFLSGRAESAMAITCDSELFDTVFELREDTAAGRTPVSERVPAALGRAS